MPIHFYSPFYSLGKGDVFDNAQVALVLAVVDRQNDVHRHASRMMWSAYQDGMPRFFRRRMAKRMAKVFADFDVAGFWEPSQYALKEYVGVPLTDEVVATVERELGYKLPASYIEFMRFQNGGISRQTSHRTKERTSWSHDHIAITGMYSIGGDKPCSLLGGFGSEFWVEEWGYPPIGVYFADCPSAGHDMVCLDYRACGSKGEPQVVHIDQERDYKVVVVAESFEAFIRGLEDDSAFDPDGAPGTSSRNADAP